MNVLSWRVGVSVGSMAGVNGALRGRGATIVSTKSAQSGYVERRYSMILFTPVFIHL